MSALVELFMIFTVWTMTQCINSITHGYKEKDGTLHITSSELKVLRIAPLLIYAIAYPLHMLLKEFIL
jgi:hypothetical protein